MIPLILMIILMIILILLIIIMLILILMIIIMLILMIIILLMIILLLILGELKYFEVVVSNLGMLPAQVHPHVDPPSETIRVDKSYLVVGPNDARVFRMEYIARSEDDHYSRTITFSNSCRPFRAPTIHLQVTFIRSQLVTILLIRSQLFTILLIRSQ